MSSKYNPGDQVVIRSDIEYGHSYCQHNKYCTEIQALHQETRFAGQIVTIQRCEIDYNGICTWYYIEDDAHIHDIYRRAYIVDEMIERRIEDSEYEEVDVNMLMNLITKE